mgnify:CR=1 FL=1
MQVELEVNQQEVVRSNQLDQHDHLLNDHNQLIDLSLDQ